jgi:hypothetical protein
LPAIEGLPSQPIPDLLIACVTVYIKGDWGAMKRFLVGEGIEPASEVAQALMAGAAGMATAWRLVAQGLGTTVEEQWQSAMLFRARARS